MRILNQANLSSHRIAEIEAQLPDLENLKDVMNWALSYPAGTFIPHRWARPKLFDSKSVVTTLRASRRAR